MENYNQQKVLHIMSSDGGGISSFIKNKAENFTDGKVVFDVITFDKVSEEFKNKIEKTGGTIYKVVNPKKEGFNKFYKQVQSVMEKQPKNTVVHSHVNGIKALPFYLITKRNRIKRFIIHAHTAAPSLSNSSYQEKMKMKMNNTMSKEKLSCGVKASKNIFGEEPMESNQIVHIPNSINYKQFMEDGDADALKKEILGIEGNCLIIGSIARFKSIKNHHFMIEIIEKLKEKNIEFLWFFAGDGSLKEEIENLVREKKLEKYIRFLGRREDIPDLFKIMDLFVLPSLNEGLPTVVIEAQAASVQSYISDTITRECDLDLNLVKFLPIDDAERWADEISLFKPKIIKKTNIEEQLIKNKFTNEASAELYEKFLNGQIVYYNI